MRLFVIFLVVIVSGVDAFAQTPPVRLTLNDAIERGLETNHRLGELRAREEAARAVEDQRKASALPQITALASFTRTNHVDEFSVPNSSGGVRVIYPDIPDNYRTRVDLQWPIYTGGRLGALSEAAGAEAEALGQDREALRGDVKLEITRAYWAVITARASLDVVAQALTRTVAHLADVRNQLNVGLVPPNDVLSIEAQQAHQQMLQVEARNIFLTASADFRRLVGLPPETPFELVDPIERLPLLRRETGAAVDIARANRAERKSLELRVDSAADRLSAAAAGRLPTLTARGGYDLARPNTRIFPLEARWRPSWELGINLNWSLFDGGRVRAEVAEADASRRAAEERLREFDSSIDAEVRQRTGDLESSVVALEAAESGVRAAGEARRVVTDRFAAGVATNTDVLNAQVALLQADLDRTRALANAQLASARLDRVLGR